MEEEEEEEVVGEDREKAAEMSRKEKRKAMKKLKRKLVRKEVAAKEREEAEAKLNDPAEQERLKEIEEEEARIREKELKEFEESERAWREAMEINRKKEEEEEAKREEEERRWKDLEELRKIEASGEDEDGDYEYIEEGPPEIIFQGNEIIFRKNRVRVPKKSVVQVSDRPSSNPLPPETDNYENVSSAQQILDNVAQEVPNFGTEQDKAHCPFHLKTGSCRFGPRCNRVHFYPDKSCTLLMKNMYNGPGIAWEQDEGLEVCNRCHLMMHIDGFPLVEVHDYNLGWSGVLHLYYTDEEAARCYEEFYEDVHTEFLKYGELINFKVCRNGSFHLKGNVYVHYKSLESAFLAYQSINGRYFAGKQVKCEFVNISKWKVAICGEYMKSRLETCSRGSACNFIHCFRNPGEDYEWADHDKPPPRFWIRKMTALFGYSDEYLKQMEREYLGTISDSRSDRPTGSHRQDSRRSRSRDDGHVTGSKSSYKDSKNHDDVCESSRGGKRSRRQDENRYERSKSRSSTRDGSLEREMYRERQYSKETYHHESKWSTYFPEHRVIRKRIHGKYSDDDYSDGDDCGRRETGHKPEVRRGGDRHERSSSRCSHEGGLAKSRHHPHKRSDVVEDKEDNRKTREKSQKTSPPREYQSDKDKDKSRQKHRYKTRDHDSDQSTQRETTTSP